MPPTLQVDVKEAKKAFFQVRGRFNKLQGLVVGEALLAASEPVVAAAQALAPVLRSTKQGRQPGQLRGRIGPTLVRRYRFVSVKIGPTRLSNADKQFPFWGKFQEMGWWLTSHTPKDRAALTRRQARALGLKSKKASRKRLRFIAGSHYLKRAGEQNFKRVEQIFSDHVIRGFEEIQAAGEQAGLGLIQ